MNIAKLCNKTVVTIRQNEDVTVAAKLMREHHVGYLVVVQPEVSDGSSIPVGVLTDRDLVIEVLAPQVDPRSLRVGDVMTEQPVMAGEAEDIGEALQKMRRIGVRRLPVIGSRGQLVGILSLDDVLDALAGELGSVAASIRQEQRMESALRP